MSGQHHPGRRAAGIHAYQAWLFDLDGDTATLALSDPVLPAPARL